MAVVQQLREIPLPQHLVHAHRHAVGKVQAAAGVPHGHADAVLLIFRKQRFRQTGVLAPEHQISPVRVLYIGVALGRLGGKVVVGAVVAGKKVRKAIVIGDVQIVPVVQPGMLELFVVNGKAMGPTRCRRQAVQAQVRATLPVFWGMRGSTRTIFRVGLSIIKRPPVPPAGGTGGAAAARTTRRNGCPAYKACPEWPAKQTPQRYRRRRSGRCPAAASR